MLKPKGYCTLNIFFRMSDSSNLTHPSFFYISSASNQMPQLSKSLTSYLSLRSQDIFMSSRSLSAPTAKNTKAHQEYHLSVFLLSSLSVPTASTLRPDDGFYPLRDLGKTSWLEPQHSISPLHITHPAQEFSKTRRFQF